MIIKDDDETGEQFSERVRQRMAAASGIACSTFTRHDGRELVKRLTYKRKTCDDRGKG